MNKIIQQLARLGATQTGLYGALTLIGPPRSGKTTLWRNLAIEDGYIPLIINPAICAPEDVGGIPVLDREKGTANYTQPLIIPTALMQEEKVWIIVDELDKAEIANQVPLLTLLAERRIREFHLPEQWRVTVAMNEPKMNMEEALIERLLFIPYSPTAEAVKPTLKLLRSLPLAFYKATDVQFPSRTVTRGALHYADSWAQHREVWRDEDTRAMLLRGLFPQNAAAALMAELGELERVLDPLDMFTNGHIEDVAPSLVALLCHATSEGEEAFTGVLNAWKKRIDADKTGEWQRLAEKWGGKDDERSLKAQAVIGRDATPEKIAAAQAGLDELLSELPSLKAKGNRAKKAAEKADESVATGAATTAKKAKK